MQKYNFKKVQCIGCAIRADPNTTLGFHNLIGIGGYVYTSDSDIIGKGH